MGHTYHCRLMEEFALTMTDRYGSISALGDGQKTANCRHSESTFHLDRELTTNLKIPTPTRLSCCSLVGDKVSPNLNEGTI